MKQVLVLDFEGVLCDGLIESMLVTWNGFYHKSLDDFSNHGLAALPAAFVERFTLYRSFARHPGHFAVSLLNPTTAVLDQDAFETLYQALPENFVKRFMQHVSAYRERARQQKEHQWLAYHRFYPGIDRLLNTTVFPLYIVTAKDASSVCTLLKHAGIPFHPDHIYGAQQDKIGALQVIQRRETVEKPSVFFVDDSIANVIAARDAGYIHASWASWGFTAPIHNTLAHANGIPALSLETFVQSTTAGNEHDMTETLFPR